MKILILIFFFEIKESKITRGHNYTLVKKQSRLDVRKFSFSQRTINVWNNLSTDCVHASSVNMFKNKIDKYLVKAGYTGVERGSSVGRMPDSQSREPGFESPLLPFRSLGIFFHFTTPQSTQLYK